jgi:hypothetical protein
MERRLSDSDIEIFIDLWQTELALFVGRVVNKLRKQGCCKGGKKAHWRCAWDE